MAKWAQNVKPQFPQRTSFNATGCIMDRWEGPRTRKDSPAEDDLDGVFASEGQIDLDEVSRPIDPLVSKRVDYIVDRAKAAVHRNNG